MDTPTINYTQLNRELDKAKSKIFLTKESAFFGPILCSLHFSWDTSIKTAQTDGVHLLWNPIWFQSISQDAKATVLFHEIRHASDLHFIRRGTRDIKRWNVACDIHINNTIKQQGFSFADLPDAWVDPVRGNTFGNSSPEDIYDFIENWDLDGFDSDMTEPSNETKLQNVNAVNNAIQSAKIHGGSSNGIAGDIENTINTFLTPVIPWQSKLEQFCVDLIEDQERTWERPNRRYSHTYLPSYRDSDTRLAHLAYFIDVSGSITLNNIARVNSEIRYIKNNLNPKKLSLIQFSTVITKIDDITEEDSFDGLIIYGRGSTSLHDVRNYIIEHQPTAAIVFSDLECRPMEPYNVDVPMVWVVIDNPEIEVPFGETIRI